jgi:phosphatidylglycerol:prolipoprotein diacylglycerol transferase
MVWYGGLIGGGAAVAWGIRRRGLPFRRVLDAFAPALAVGHAIGHVACFFSGDSYGVPSELPWAVAFPRGAPPSTAGNLRNAFGVDVPAGIPDGALLTVHPTMLYSAAVLLLVAAFLWWYRNRSGAAGRLFGLYLVLAGAERFLVEFLRAKDDRLLWGATTAQAIAVVLLLAGLVLLRTWRGGGEQRREVPAEPEGPTAPEPA